MFEERLVTQAASLLELCRGRKLRIATAESCTGGLVSALLTEIPGSSDVLERGFVTYSNAAKTDVIGVPPDLIAAHGAVSEAVARAMAQGTLARSAADIALAVTGVAGPGGGTAAKPVGMVCFGIVRRGREPSAVTERFGDLGRSNVRLRAVATGLVLLRDAASQD
jgi:nicotinamide-nucleotide amidase